MKKLFILAFLLVLSAGLMAQTGTTTVFPQNSSSAKYTPIAADTLNGTSAATKYWVFNVNKSNLYYMVATCQFTAVTTTARASGSHIILTISGSIDGTNYTTIDTTLFHPAATGNYRMGIVQVPYIDVSTGLLWKYLKFSANALDANKAAILTSLALKIGEKK